MCEQSTVPVHLRLLSPAWPADVDELVCNEIPRRQIGRARHLMLAKPLLDVASSLVRTFSC